MEGFITGDLVVCIGQSAVLIGREVKALNSKIDLFQFKVAPIFVYVDDFGISDDSVKKSDHYYRFPKRCSTYFEGYESGNAIVDFLIGVLETSDTCQSVSFIFSADEGLGSGLTAFLVQYFAHYMPGMIILTIGILPHLNQGSLPSINTCLVLQQCLSCASCCMLRRLNDTTHLLSSRKTAKSESRSSVFQDVSRCVAADVLLAIREVGDGSWGYSCSYSTAMPLITALHSINNHTCQLFYINCKFRFSGLCPCAALVASSWI